MTSFQAERTYALLASSAANKHICDAEKIGAKVILFPVVETESIAATSQTNNLLKNLSSFDWVVFTSIFAVDYFLQALENLEIDFYELDALRVCAYGETIADRLRFSQIHSDVISNDATTENVFHALKNYEADFESLRFLIPKDKNMTIGISSLLTDSGAKVTEFPLYCVQIRESAQLPKLKALLKGGAIDEFIFSSPADAAGLAILFETENLSDLLGETMVTAIDSATRQSLIEFGINRIVIR